MTDAFARALHGIMPGELALAIANRGVYRPDEPIIVRVNALTGRDPAPGTFFATQGAVTRHGPIRTVGAVLEMYSAGSDYDITIELEAGQTHFARPNEYGGYAFPARGLMGPGAKFTIRPSEITYTEVVAASAVTATGGSPQPSVTGTGTPYTAGALIGLLAEITKADDSVQYAVIVNNTTSALTVASVVTGTASSVRVVKPATVLQTSQPDGTRASNGGIASLTKSARGFSTVSITAESGRDGFVVRDLTVVPVLASFAGALTAENAQLSAFNCVFDYESAFGVSGWQNNSYALELNGACDYVRLKNVGFANPGNRAVQAGFANLSESARLEGYGVVFDTMAGLVIRKGEIFWSGVHLVNFTNGTPEALSLADVAFYPAYIAANAFFGSRSSIVGCQLDGLKMSGGTTNGFRFSNSGAAQQGMQFDSVGGDALELDNSAKVDLLGSAGGWVVNSAVGYSLRFSGAGCVAYFDDTNMAGGTAGDIKYADSTPDATFSGLSPSGNDTRQNFVGVF